MRPITKHTKEAALSTIDEIKAKLLAMNPAQLNMQLAAINQLLKGIGTVIDVKLPTEAQKTHGRPKGTPNKPKTTRRDPSAFEHVEKKRKI
ncbi:hypothetical protein PTTG_10932, partial [Puccinia triticina 1-1 BBBD Race 1]